MKLTKKTKVIIPAVLSILACGSVIAGSSYALFTSESAVNVAITSGKVDVSAVVDGELTTSHKEVDSTSNEYVEKEGLYGGTATLDKENQTLTIDKLLPMDKISFKIKVTNNSDVTIKYRTMLKALEDSGLFAGLKITVDNEEFTEGTTVKTDYETYAVGTGSKTVDVTIEMPEDAGNEYQGKSCKLSYAVEAIQGNAKNPRDPVIVTAEVSKGEDNKTDKETTISSTETTGSAPVVSATVPAGVTLDADATSLTLSVSETKTSSNMSYTAADTVETLEISLEGLSTDNTAVVIVNFYAQENLENFVLYHSDVKMTSVDSDDEVDQNNEYHYTPATGMVKMAVTSFSPFTFVNHKGTPVSTYAELKAGLEAKKDISLLNDITIDALLDLSTASTDVSIYGNGYSLIPGTGVKRIFQLNLTSDDYNVSLYDLKCALKYGPDGDADSRCVAVGANTGKVVINVENCTLESKYAIKLAGGNTNVTLNVKNSTITGYEAIDTWSPNSIINVEYSTLIGKNHYEKITDNDCHTIGVEGESGAAATGSVLTFRNSVIDTDTLEDGNTQYHICFTVEGKATFENCKFKKNGVASSIDVNAWDGLYSGTDDDAAKAADKAFAERLDSEGWITVR